MIVYPSRDGGNSYQINTTEVHEKCVMLSSSKSLYLESILEMEVARDGFSATINTVFIFFSGIMQRFSFKKDQTIFHNNKNRH